MNTSRLRNRSKTLFTTALVALLLATFAGPAAASGHQIRICHANEGVNDYSSVNEPKWSIYNAGGHSSGGSSSVHPDDIIPPFTAGSHGSGLGGQSWGDFAGFNWNTETEAIWNNNCSAPDEPPPPPPPSTVDVCELATGEIININEDAQDPALHGDVNDPACDDEGPPPPTMIDVCELATGEIINIDEDDEDPSSHGDVTDPACDEEEPPAPGGGGGSTGGGGGGSSSSSSPSTTSLPTELPTGPATSVLPAELATGPGTPVLPTELATGVSPAGLSWLMMVVALLAVSVGGAVSVLRRR